jgi:hypothetical protein
MQTQEIYRHVHRPISGFKDVRTYSESETAGMMPSMVDSSFGSSLDTSQAMILPSIPHVV